MVKVYILMVINHEQVGGEKRINRYVDTHNVVSGVGTWGMFRSLKRSTTSVPYKQKPTDYIIRRLELVRVVGVATCGDYPESRGATSPLRMVRVQVPERLLSYV